MKSSTLVLRSLVLMASLTLVAPASGALIVLQPGPEGKDINIADGQLAGTNLSFNGEWLITAWSPGPAGRPRSAGLIEFDLAPIAGTDIQSASLVLYQSDNFDPNATYSVFRVTSEWTESSVTFNTAPTFDPTPEASLTLPASDINGGPGGIPVRSAFRTWDVTNLVQNWVAGTYFNFGMWVERTAQDPNDDRPSVYFAASDWPAEEPGFPPGPYGTQYRPALVVEYAAVPIPAALPLVLAGLGVVSAFARSVRRVPQLR